MKFITLHRVTGPGKSWEFVIAAAAIGTFEDLGESSRKFHTGGNAIVYPVAGEEAHIVTETAAEIAQKLRELDCEIEGQDDPADLEAPTYELPTLAELDAASAVFEELEKRVDALGEEVGP